MTPVFPARPAEGLPATGATLLLATACFLGALVDIVIAARLGWTFGTAFVLGSAWTAARLRRSDRAATLITPPLVFACVAFLAVQFVTRGDGLREFAVNEALGLGGALGSGAPVLFAGLAAAGAVLVARVLAERSDRS